MAYEIEIAAFAEDQWNWVSCDEVPRQKNTEIVRAAIIGMDAEIATSRAFLAKFISPVNYAISSTATAYTIENPMVNKIPQPGVWRLVSVSWDEQSKRFIQKLRLGWATSVLSSSTFNDEAFLVEGQAIDIKNSQRTVEWRNIAQASLETCAQAIRTAASFTNPVASGNTLTGTWLALEADPILSDDGSGVLRVKIQKCLTGNNGTAVTFSTANGDTIIQREYPVGMNQAGLVRIFYYRDTAARDVLIASGGEAAKDVTEGNITYNTSGWSLQDHGGGIWTITQHLVKSRFFYFDRWKTESKILDHQWSETVRTNAESENTPPTWAVKTFARYKELCSTESDAQNKATTTGVSVYDEHGNVKKLGTVVYAGQNADGNDRWWAYSVVIS